MTKRPDHLVLVIENLSRLSEALDPWIDEPKRGELLPERTMQVSVVWALKQISKELLDHRQMLAHPLMVLKSDQDRFQEFLFEAMRAVMAQHPNSTSPDWITSQATAIATGLFDRYTGKWAP